jgi:inorganic pyrophosphatase
MIDNDESDEKIIAVSINDPSKNVYNDISELPEHIFSEIKHFFTVYKALEHDKKTMVTEIQGAKEAKESIAKAINMYKKLFLK